MPPVLGVSLPAGWLRFQHAALINFNVSVIVIIPLLGPSSTHGHFRPELLQISLIPSASVRRTTASATALTLFHLSSSRVSFTGACSRVHITY